MKSIGLFSFVICLFFMSCSTEQEQVRESDFNLGWKFALGDFDGAEEAGFDDAAWKDVQLPHDWSVELPFDTVTGEGCVGFLPGGIGWYRKQFQVDYSKNQNVYVLFDGVYNHSEYWVNGQKLGDHVYGYTPIYFDLTPYLKEPGEKNFITVRVDHSRIADSRWYTGSGIYRNVTLIKSDKLHIPIWGTFVTTPEVSTELAKVKLELQVKNDYAEVRNFTLNTKIIDPDGKQILTQGSEYSLNSKAVQSIDHAFQLNQPRLWGVTSPNLYKAVSQVIVDGKVVDEYTTRFGVRSIKFDPDSGFYLNGENMKIKGVCLHHAAGLVGAAVPKAVWKRRLITLKEAGCNAIRGSHNPLSQEFLDLCDELGLMVQDEFFDEWDYPKDKRLNGEERHDDYASRGFADYFEENAEKELKTTVLAHRNHPSIIQWSIGNEIEWTYPRNKQATGFWDANWSGNYFWQPTPLTPEQIKKRYDELPALEHNIGETAQKLSKWTKEIDTTRPVVANCILPSASYVTGYADALDVIGFSYRRVMYDYGHKYFPKLPIMGTENLAQWHEWKAIMERPFIAGTFLWTGIDYMGEAHGRKMEKNGVLRPQKGLTCGMLDLAGFEKPSYYMMKSLWSDDPTLHISTQVLEKSIYKLDSESGEPVEKEKGAWEHRLWFWHDVNEHWNYQAGDKVIVEVISNCPEVELFLNDKSLGVKKLADNDDHVYKWAVDYADGQLTAKGLINESEVVVSLTTASKVTSIELSVDHSELKADGYDVAHVVAQLIDENGVPVKTEDQLVSFNVNGNVKVLGVDNGDIQNFMDYQSNKVMTSRGRALLIVQSTPKSGEISISASSDNIKSQTMLIKSKK